MPNEKKVDTLQWMNEYFYAESLREFNLNRAKNGLPIVSTTQARVMHAKYMQTFETNYANYYNAIYNNPKYPAGSPNRDAYIRMKISGLMTGTFNATFKDVNDGKAYYATGKGVETSYSVADGYYCLGFEEAKRVRADIIGHFRDNTGWDIAYTEQYKNGTREIPVDKQKLCVSPYDERFSMRQVVLDNGGRILWTDTENLVANTGEFEEERNKDIRLYEERCDEDGFPLSENPMYRASSLSTPDDLTGLSALRPYMSNTDYNKVRNSIQHSNARMSPQALDRSIAILQWLTNNGYEYKITTDTYPGQLKAKIGNSKLEIRIMDIPKNEQYIGRCYEEGYETYFRNDSRNKYPVYKEPDTEDVLKMISYVLGNNVERTSYNNGEMSNVMQGNYPNTQLGVKRPGDDIGRYAGQSAHAFSKMENVGTKARPVYEAAFTELDGVALQKSKTGDDAYPNSSVLLDVTVEEPTLNKKGQPSFARRKYLAANMRSQHHASHEFFDTPEDANEFLKAAVESARNNYVEKLDIERLVEEARLHAGEPDYTPEFSYDPSIQPIQAQYWEVLSGKRDLYRFDVTPDEVRDELDFEEYDEDGNINTIVDSIFGSANTSLKYEGDIAEQVRQHAADVLDYEFGSLEPSETDGLRFNPSNVATFMDSAYGRFRNNDNIVEALKVADISADELRGNEFLVNQIKDKLVKFNPETAHQMVDENSSDFMKAVHQTIVESISTSHCEVDPNTIMIDDKGIVHYTAQRRMITGDAKHPTITMEPIEGTIGQIFEPDEDGVVETQFNGSQNQLFSPGYLAYVLPQNEGENKSLPERMRLKGYLHVLQDNIRRQIRSDLLSPRESTGTTTSINNSYRGLYETRYKVHGMVHDGETLKQAYVRECEMTGLPADVVKARFETFNGMIRLPSDFKEDSSLNAAFAHDFTTDSVIEDAMNDNARDAWQLSGGENISILSEGWDGYTDKTATGSAKNQGVVRYMVRGAHVDENGVLHPALNEDGTIKTDARTALMEIEDMKYVENTPFDRQQMVFSNLSGASAISRDTGVLMMTAGGYTFDDGCIISKEWAIKNGPIGEDGERRPLKPGDKVLDMAGNKSIVGKIVDTDISDEDFAKLDKVNQELITLVRQNPDVDVIVSPYSPMSRFNSTTARFGIENSFEVTLPDGRKTYGGTMPVVVTDKTVDEKTKEYGDDEVKAGGGRSASGQFNWILSAKGAYGLMDECYGNTESSWSAYREYLISMGLDMDETAKLRVGYQPQGDEQRHVFTLPELSELDGISSKTAGEMFKNAVDNRGGFLEVPVQLTLPSGEKLQPCPADKSQYAGAGQTYMLPILSSYLRSGQEFQDGTSTTHDYTNHYAQIYKSAVEYTKLLNAVPQPGENENAKTKRKEAMERLAGRMQSEYNEITSDIETRVFTGKHNFVRDHLMSNRLPHSSTAVWTAEPACKIDEIRMPASMAKTLGVKDGEMVLAWRDPCLHESSLSGFNVVIDNTPEPNKLTGVAVNPLIASRMDGDFDGDSIGLYGVSSEAGKKDLEKLFAIHNTLLDRVHKKEKTSEDEPDKYDLFINTKMDVKSLYAVDEERRAKAEAEGHPIETPSFRERFDALETRVNDIYFRRGDYAGKTDAEIAEAKKTACDDLSTWTHELFESCPLGAQMLSMENESAYMKDLVHMAETKAKGKMSAIKDAMKYYGATYEMKTDAEGNKTIDYDSIQVADGTLATRQDAKDTMFATAVKANGTPLGGQFSLNIAEITRNKCFGHALDLTYNATQAALQAKHDAVMAKQQYHMLQGALKSQWRGHKLESKMVPVYTDECDASGRPIQAVDENGKGIQKKVWHEVKEPDAYGNMKPVQLKPDEWVKQFMDIHTHPDGMNLDGDVNIEQVKLVAKALTSEKTGFVYDIESKEAREELAMPMDRLAYQPSFAATLEAAKSGECMLEGDANFHLGPKTIRENIRRVNEYNEAVKQAQAQAEAGVEVEEVAKPDVKGFSKSDVIEHDGVKAPTAYETSSKYVHANKDGIGHVVTGGYTAPEDRPQPKAESVEDYLTDEDLERYKNGTLFEEESPIDQMTDAEKAKAYANLSVEDAAQMSDEQVSELALAAQEYEADKDDEYDDDIDDGELIKDDQGGVSDEIADALAEKSAEQMKVEHPDTPSTPASTTPEEQTQNVFSTAATAEKKAELAKSGMTSPVDD